MVRRAKTGRSNPAYTTLGGNLPWPLWNTLNKYRVRVVRTKYNMVKWGFSENDYTCECG